MKSSGRSARVELLNFDTFCLYIVFTLSPNDTTSCEKVNGCIILVIHDASRAEAKGFIHGGDTKMVLFMVFTVLFKTCLWNGSTFGIEKRIVHGKEMSL